MGDVTDLRVVRAVRDGLVRERQYAALYQVQRAAMALLDLAQRAQHELANGGDLSDDARSLLGERLDACAVMMAEVMR